MTRIRFRLLPTLGLTLFSLSACQGQVVDKDPDEDLDGEGGGSNRGPGRGEDGERPLDGGAEGDGDGDDGVVGDDPVVVVAGGGSLNVGSGGGPAFGGTSGGGTDQRGAGGMTSGAGGEYPSHCSPPSTGVGGAIFIPSCNNWLGGGTPGWVVPNDCEGIEGLDEEAAGETPALRRFCETNPEYFNHVVHQCLTDAGWNACGPDHEQQVLDCLLATPPPTCPFDLTTADFDAFAEACPELSINAVYGVAGLGEREDAVSDCIEGRPEDEPCDESFLRCAYGLL